MSTNIEESIKIVAIYLRKSRGDEEKDLINHEIKLTEITEANGWEYEIYREGILSGSSIEDRPVMIQLLKDVEEQEFDAILTMDIDRLTRGSGADQDRLFYSLKVSGTKIVTASPFNILDVENESHVDMLNMKSFFGNYELRTITKRLKMGRMISAQRGFWVFGRAPYGYVYDRDTKKLKPDPETSPVVKRIVTEFLEQHKSSGDIAWGLNKDGILSSMGSQWSYGMITKLLRRDVYQGKIVFNKSKGNNQTKERYNANPFIRLPESEWKVRHNTHEALITEEQRREIDEHFNSYNRRKAKKASDGSVFDLSGLVRNSEGFRYTRKFENGRKESMVLSIDNRLPKDKAPKHQSINPALVRKSIAESIEAIELQLSENLQQKDNDLELEAYHKKLKELSDTHNTILASYERIIDGYTGGLYDMEKAKELKEEKEKEQDEIEFQLRQVRHKIDTFSNSKNVDRLDRIKQFKEDIAKATSNTEINLLYKSIIKDIVADRESLTKIKIRVNFL